MSTPDTTPAEAPVPQPQGGGSYVRHPVTGALTLVERTLSREEAAEQPAEEPTDPEA